MVEVVCPKAWSIYFLFHKSNKAKLTANCLILPEVGPVCLPTIPQLHTEYSLLRQRPCMFLFLHYNLERLLGSVNIWWINEQVVHNGIEFRLSPILAGMNQTAQSTGVHQLVQDPETPGCLCSWKAQLLQSDITLRAVCASIYLKMQILWEVFPTSHLL